MPHRVCSRRKLCRVFQYSILSCLIWKSISKLFELILFNRVCVELKAPTRIDFLCRSVFEGPRQLGTSVVCCTWRNVVSHEFGYPRLLGVARLGGLLGNLHIFYVDCLVTHYGIVSFVSPSRILNVSLFDSRVPRITTSVCLRWNLSTRMT